MDAVEKVLHLLHLLNGLCAHPYLKGKFVLKGGTALNLFVFDLPRLSVDIDLNYIGALDRDAMLGQKPRIEQALQAVFAREGYTIKRVPDEHAGGKWRLSYPSFTGQSGNLEVDLNFMFRQPLWEARTCNSCKLGLFHAGNIPVLDIHELAAGKLAALLTRGQARDLFDCARILNLADLEPDRLRLAFVVYGGMVRKDWRSVSIDDVAFEAGDLVRSLIPMLNVQEKARGNPTEEYGRRLVEECRAGLSALLPFLEGERAFLDRLLDHGEINAALLTADESLQRRIESQPLLEWKAINVRRYKGLS